MIICLGLRKLCEIYVDTSDLQRVQNEFTAKYFIGTTKSSSIQKENFTLQIFNKQTKELMDYQQFET